MMTERAFIHVEDSPIRALAERLRQEVREIPLPSAAFSGGRTPRELFSLLAAEYRDSLPWNRMKVFQVDERGVGPDHEDSNWRQIRERLLDPLPHIRAFRMEAERGVEGASDYAAVLDRELPKNESGVPTIDFVLLGMGPDGHTASLFPETRALEIRDRTVVYNEVPQLQTYRLTLTYPVLEAASHRWFLLTGADKADTLEEVLAGSHPAGRLREVEWFVDRALGEVLANRGLISLG